MSTISKLKNIKDVDPITDNLEGWTVTEGSPVMKTWILHTNNDETMISGYWESTPGSYHATYKEYEFVHLLEGHIIITPDGGNPVEVKSCDTFVVENDFSGTWQIIETVRKYFDVKLK